jgi:hypothetical protein
MIPGVFYVGELEACELHSLDLIHRRDNDSSGQKLLKSVMRKSMHSMSNLVVSETHVFRTKSLTP